MPAFCIVLDPKRVSGFESTLAGYDVDLIPTDKRRVRLNYLWLKLKTERKKMTNLCCRT